MVFELWREYPVKPRWRWAASLEVTDSGYKVKEHNADVADIGFLHVVADNMARPVTDTVSVDDDGVGTQVFKPGDPTYFERAVRQIPHVQARREKK